MKHIFLTFLLLLALSAKSQAPQKQSYSFSLEQAISHAIEHNRASINATRDIEIAKQKKKETTSTGLPQVNASVDYANNLAVPLSVVPAKFLDPTAPDGQFAAVAFTPKQTVNAVATLRQLLFDGSYIVALQASKTYLEYYENAKLRTNSEVREMIINAYGNVLLSEESITILMRNKSSLDKTLFDTRETFKNGLVEEENVEQLQITSASINSFLNNATRVRDIAYKNLKIALGLDINDDLTLTDKLDDLTLKNLGASMTQTGFDVNNNIDYKMAQNFEQQRMLELKLQRSTYLPTLAANLNFGYNAFDSDFAFFDSKYYNFSTFGVNLDIPIFSSFGRKSRTQQAKIALEQAKTQLVDTEQKLKLQYESAKSTYDFNVEEFTTAKENLRLAERIEKKQQTKFSEGLSTSFDFADAQRQLYSAQQDYLQSMINIINAKAALERVTNSSN